MNDSPAPGVYLIVEFNWPRPFEPEHGQSAQALHQAVQGRTWIREAVAASGGIGGGASSVWIFGLEGYQALERLLRDPEDEVASAYRAFFSNMDDVQDRVREEVVFRRRPE